MTFGIAPFDAVITGPNDGQPAVGGGGPDILRRKEYVRYAGPHRVLSRCRAFNPCQRIDALRLCIVANDDDGVSGESATRTIGPTGNLQVEATALVDEARAEPHTKSRENGLNDRWILRSGPMTASRWFPSSLSSVESPGIGESVVGIRYSVGPDPVRPIDVMVPRAKSATTTPLSRRSDTSTRPSDNSRAPRICVKSMGKVRSGAPRSRTTGD
jgi:hypothetical protein